MVKQKFYVVAHNPNTVREAEDFLRAGVNALGPDIKYHEGEFYVSHGGAGSNQLTEEFTLVNYLRGLRTFIIDSGNLNLALIIFDIKDPVFDINVFLQLVHQHFSRFPICSDVALMVTVADIKDAGFLLAFDGSIPNVGIGIDQHDKPQEVAEVLKNAKHKNTAYADGITASLKKPQLYYTLTEARHLQHLGDSFKMVFTWVLASEESFRSYLHLSPDAILVDYNEVESILGVLKEHEFSDKIELAKNGHNPWLAPLPPSYSLTVKTRDRIFAGTDARLRFRLIGSMGKVESIIDTSYDQMMEKGNINHLVLQGEDIGQIQTLSVKMISKGFASSWLPEYFEVNSKIHPNTIFSFGEDEWLTFENTLVKSMLPGH